MSDARPCLLDVADPENRLQKSHWRQMRSVLSRTMGEALKDSTVAAPRIGLLGGPQGMPASLSSALGHEVVPLDLSADRATERCHLVASCPSDSLSAAQRVAHLRKAFESLRVAGALVVLATVVQDPRRTGATRPPRISELLEEIALAGGGAGHVEEIASIRWGDEPIIRGVALTLRFLTLQGGET